MSVLGESWEEATYTEQEALHPTRFLPTCCTLRAQSRVHVATFPDTHPTQPGGCGWAGRPPPAGLDSPQFPWSGKQITSTEEYRLIQGNSPTTPVRKWNELQSYTYNRISVLLKSGRHTHTEISLEGYKACYNGFLWGVRLQGIFTFFFSLCSTMNTSYRDNKEEKQWNIYLTF